MARKIGFVHEKENTENCRVTESGYVVPIAVKPCLATVFFASEGKKFTYYNDRFDLHEGDIVYVEGKLAGLRGRVTEIAYGFKIRLSDYKRIIGCADRRVRGTFYTAGSHLITFAQDTLPFEQAFSWFGAAEETQEPLLVGTDPHTFLLSELEKEKIDRDIVKRGIEYYEENRVVYCSLRGDLGRAIVDGTRAYVVEFTYRDGLIGDLLCDCPYHGSHCKHELAVLLQLRECLDKIKTDYAEAFCATGSFAAVALAPFRCFALENTSATLTLS